MIKILRHRDILRPNDAVHLTRANLTSQRPNALHGHDFYEVFWVQNGQIRHHHPSGIDVLPEGSLVLISPRHTHALQGKGTDSFVVSLCVHPDVVDGICKRHAGLWPNDGAPFGTHLGIRQLTAMNQSVLALERGQRDHIAAESFLLPLLAGLRKTPTPDGVPDWLINAMTAAQNPNIFRNGASGFVAQTGRAHPHVSRTMRKFFDQSPSDFINGVRMKFAANQLLTDQDSVREIAAACGIPNMAHFHKLFKEHHGNSPLQFRQKYRQEIIQPT